MTLPRHAQERTMNSIIGGIISDYEGMWRPLAAVCGVAFALGFLQVMRERLLNPLLASRKQRRALPRLELTLPGFEETIASHGGRRWSEGPSGASQSIDDRIGRPRVEPTFDKPVR
jgi:hypothetical protein